MKSRFSTSKIVCSIFHGHHKLQCLLNNVLQFSCALHFKFVSLDNPFANSETKRLLCNVVSLHFLLFSSNWPHSKFVKI